MKAIVIRAGELGNPSTPETGPEHSNAQQSYLKELVIEVTGSWSAFA